MTKKEIVIEVAKKTGLSKKDVEKVYEAFFSPSGVLKQAVEKHGKVVISGFGVFEKKHLPERIAMNPYEGKKIKVPEKDVIKFRLSKKFKEL